MSVIGNRVAKLEDATNPLAARRVVVMWRDEGESASAAIARWCADHPGEPVPAENDPNVLIITWVLHDPPSGKQPEKARYG